MRLRAATLDDLDRLRHWDAQPHVAASDPHDDWGWERELARDPDWREQLIAEIDGRPIGFVQVIDPAREDSHYWGDCEDGLRAIDIWIGEASDLGRGLGTQMMRLALARCFSQPSVEAVVIDPLASNTRARRFYERLGFRFVELRRFGLDDCAVYRLERSTWRASDAAPWLSTARLALRAWRPEDRAPFAALNADERVAQFLPATLSRAESDTLADHIEAGFDRHGFGLWAVERRDVPARPFIGFIGLSVPRFSAAFTPCVEIGWRLAPEHWGRGLATEGARAASRYAFEVLRLDEIVSFTVTDNIASRRVMEKIGMQRDPREDFDHPALTAGDPLRRHVLYRLRAASRGNE